VLDGERALAAAARFVAETTEHETSEDVRAAG